MLVPSLPAVSILIPTLDESSWIRHSISAARAAASTAGVSLEIIVCDGGSSDDTVAIARRFADAVVETPRACRAVQLNRGRALATGEVLAFLHADSLLVPDALTAMLDALDDGCVGGWFEIEILPETAGVVGHNALSAMAWGINARTRWFRTATADQFIFARREVLDVLDGFPEVPLFEGNRLARKMRDIGPIAVLGPHLRISGRRWERNGLLRMLFLMYALRLAERLGRPTHELHELWQRLSSK